MSFRGVKMTIILTIVGVQHKSFLVQLLAFIMATATICMANAAPLDGITGSAPQSNPQSNLARSLGYRILLVPSQFQTIQLAVDSAKPGDSIKILPGTYVEQVNINKNLNVTGSGAADTFVKAPATLTPGSFGKLSIIDINNGATVSLSNLTVTGPGSSPCGPGSLYGGIFVSGGANINLYAATVTKIHDTPKSFCFPNGSAIRIGQPFPASDGHATIHNVEISEYQENGILVLGSGSTATIFESTITGFGAVPGVINGGVNVALGSSATVINNKISQNNCTSVGLLNCGRDPINQQQGAGIAIAGQSAATSIISGNEISTSDIGIYLYGGACTVTKNRIANSRFFGIVLQDSNYTVSLDHITGGEIGVGVVADTTNTVGTLIKETITATSIAPVKEISANTFKATAFIQK